ncbi:MAG: OB-fold nucleic acid binding domain-containing protein [Acidobacteriaceae bacterium]|nr:OB-fold nucleic acid binding domain-containing protein [Acidobacteriaceae bacterium]
MESKKEEQKTTAAAPAVEPPAPREEAKKILPPPVPTVPVAMTSFSGRVRIRYLMENPTEHLDKVIYIAGWARTTRFTKKLAFVEMSDGSGPVGLQVVVDKETPGYAELEKMRVGASMGFRGKLVKSPGAKQPVELQVKNLPEHQIRIFGDCPAELYPLAKKEHSVEVAHEPYILL